jgi:hypothetical protein
VTVEPETHEAQDVDDPDPGVAGLAGLYGVGVTIRDLAAATGRSYGWVRQRLDDAGVTLRERGWPQGPLDPPPELPPAGKRLRGAARTRVAKQMLEYREMGYTVRRIAAGYGLNRATVDRLLGEASVLDQLNDNERKV